jgi:hypothetical protein
MSVIAWVYQRLLRKGWLLTSSPRAVSLTERSSGLARPVLLSLPSASARHYLAGRSNCSQVPSMSRWCGK